MANIVLGDDGSLDTVFECLDCGKHFRRNYASDMEGCADDDAPEYDAWREEMLTEIEDGHNCEDQENDEI